VPSSSMVDKVLTIDKASCDREALFYPALAAAAAAAYLRTRGTVISTCTRRTRPAASVIR